jgi:hypothetical protein
MSAYSDDVEAGIEAVREAEEHLTAARKQLEKAQRAKKYPKFMTLSNGAVVRFTLRLPTGYGSGTKDYEYAARKVGGYWFTTGSTCPPRGYSHQGFVNFLDKGAVVGKIEVFE